MRPKSDGATCGLLLAGTLALVSILTRPALEARAIVGLDTVTLTPTHGRAAASFQATYGVNPCLSAIGLTIQFSWNALPPAGPVLGSAVTDASCRATLTTKPPSNAAPGNYLVYGYVPLPTGGATPNTEASATYTVDVTPTATASASPKATPTSKATATASALATPTSVSSPGASATASAPGASAIASEQPLPAATAASASAAKPQTVWWKTLPGLALIGAALVLFGLLLALAVLLFLWIRRRSRSRSSKATDRAA